MFHKSAKDFGIEGEYNVESAKSFEEAIWQTASAGVDDAMRGYYQGRRAVFFIDVEGGYVVIANPAGEFLSAMSLPKDAMNSLRMTGELN